MAVAIAIWKWSQFYINTYKSLVCDMGVIENNWYTYLFISVLFAILTRVHLHIPPFLFDFDHAPPLGLTNASLNYMGNLIWLYSF